MKAPTTLHRGKSRAAALSLAALALLHAPGASAEPAGEGAYAHLSALQAIAAENGGNRAAGTAGYDRSADYVAGRLGAAGYEVRLEGFEFPFFEERSPPALLSGPARTPAPPEEVRTLVQSGSGAVAGPLHAVDLGLTEGVPAAGSTSGCEAADFAGFPRGAVALVRRGTCPFRTKVEHATAAGAVGVIVMNEGTERRTGAFTGHLGQPARVPVVGVGTELGRSLAAGAGEAAGVRLTVDAEAGTRVTRNVVAETRSGDPGETVVVGAHLDSVPEGPGINDNASGAAAVLDAAERLARSGTEPKRRLRFAFWGAEERGLIGSRHYLDNLADEERRRIALYINLDMVGSPNFGRFLHLKGVPDGPAAVARSALAGYFSAGNLPLEERREGGSRFHGSDDASFADKGIPTLGLYTGAGETKPETQADRFGGAAARPYDPCYHRACDTIHNIDRGVLEQMAGALAQAVDRLSSGETAPAAEAPPSGAEAAPER